MRRLCGCVSLVSGLVLCLCGCTPTAVPTFPLPTLTAAIQFVVDNAADFAEPDGLSGDDVADAAALDGCWARVADASNVELPYVGAQDVQVYDVYRFDAAVGTARSELLMQNADVNVLVIRSGTFEVTEPGLATIRMTEYEQSNPFTGAIEPVTGVESSETEVHAEIDGERLILTRTTGDSPRPFTYTRFDCP